MYRPIETATGNVHPRCSATTVLCEGSFSVDASTRQPWPRGQLTTTASFTGFLKSGASLCGLLGGLSEPASFGQNP